MIDILLKDIQEIEDDYVRNLFDTQGCSDVQRLKKGIKKYRRDIRRLLEISKYLLLKLELENNENTTWTVHSRATTL